MSFHKIILALGLTGIGYNLSTRWMKHLTRKSYVEHQILLGLHYIHELVKEIRQHQLATDGVQSFDENNDSDDAKM